MTTGLSRAFRVVGIALLVLWAGPARAARVSDPQRELSFELPADYREFGPGASAPRTLFSYVRGEPGQGAFAILRLESLGAPIGHDTLDHAELEEAARESSRGSGMKLVRFSYGTLRWKTFDLDLVATEADDRGQALVILGTQVPVKSEAVQITFIGPPSEQPRMTAELQALVASFEAPTNWSGARAAESPDQVRSRRLGELVGLAGVFVLLFVFMRSWRRRKRD